MRIVCREGVSSQKRESSGAEPQKRHERGSHRGNMARSARSGPVRAADGEMIYRSLVHILVWFMFDNL